MKHHDYHLVKPSPWPFLTSMSLFFLAISLAGFFHFFYSGLTLMRLALISVVFLLSFWWRDVIREGTVLLEHTIAVMKSIRLGFALFIVSEVMFFLSFFWAYFHSSLVPVYNIGCVWPPYNFIVLSAWHIPLLNTLILLSSGATITLAHLAIIVKKKEMAIGGFISTLFLGVLFTAIQLYEYINAPFSINDGIYGSVFYLLTGFHGLHVLVGTIMITIQYLRYLRGHFTSKNHFGFESAAWYWHFVDVVWILLFVTLYIWGNYR